MALNRSFAPGIAIEREARWVCLADGEVIHLRRRRVLRRILLALVESHFQTPGRECSAVALIAAGWPGERMVPHAGANRLYVAMNTLRRAGLRQLLITGIDGYLLDPRANIYWGELGQSEKLRAS